MSNGQKSPHEIELIKLIIANEGKLPEEKAFSLSKQETAVLAKWTRKGLWSFGVSMRTGWLTPKGYGNFGYYLDPGKKDPDDAE